MSQQGKQEFRTLPRSPLHRQGHGLTLFHLLPCRTTDADGRNNSLLAGDHKSEKNAIYKMTFYTREYFSSKGVDSFYPFVEVVFEIKEPDEHHHIALLLSPFSYTTYRGS